MSESNIIKDLNLPKQILDKSEALLKALFGETIKEFGGMIADQVRLRRFKNQLNIFEKAEKILKEKKINPKKVSLKVLVPLLDSCSLEEDDNIQDLWANLTSNILEHSDSTMFHQNSIATLNKISSDEAHILNIIFDEVCKRRELKFKEAYKTNKSVFIDDFSLEEFSVNIGDIYLESKADIIMLQYQISSLVALGILKMETKVDILPLSLEKSKELIDVDFSVQNNDDFIFTPFGFRFINICKGNKLTWYNLTS